MFQAASGAVLFAAALRTFPSVKNEIIKVALTFSLVVVFVRVQYSRNPVKDKPGYSCRTVYWLWPDMQAKDLILNFALWIEQFPPHNRFLLSQGCSREIGGAGGETGARRWCRHDAR